MSMLKVGENDPTMHSHCLKSDVTGQGVYEVLCACPEAKRFR